MQTITEYIKSKPELVELFKEKSNRTTEEMLDDLGWPFDTYDEDSSGDRVRCIYIDEEKTKTWAVSELITYCEADIREEWKNDSDEMQVRLNAWKLYMERIGYQDASIKDIIDSVNTKEIKDAIS